jgi:hypothetical protein
MNWPEGVDKFNERMAAGLRTTQVLCVDVEFGSMIFVGDSV